VQLREDDNLRHEGVTQVGVTVLRGFCLTEKGLPVAAASYLTVTARAAQV
jgi:hypothetical protein